MKNGALKRLTRKTEFYMAIVLVVMFIAIGIASRWAVIAPKQVFTILRDMTVDGMFALCSLVIMVAGGFDLSFPAISALAYSLSCTLCVNWGWCQTNPIAGFVMAAVFGWIMGMLNGWILSKFKLNTMIVTLGTQTFFTGLSMGLLEMKEITSTLPDGMKQFGKSFLFEYVNPESGIRSQLTTMILFYLALCLIVSFLLRKTMFGRALYAIGGNEVSAERAGYNVRKVKFLLYSAVGAVAGFTGMIRVCLERQSIPKALVGREMTIIPAVILGGASIYGGEGSVIGTMIAIAIIKLVSNSMLLIGINPQWQSFFNGIVILIGITVSAVQARRSSKV